VRKLISIGILLALLVTFVVPAIVAAGDNVTCECGPEGPCPAVPPASCPTDSAGGAVLWSLLATTYIMGRAVGDVTETLAGTLGCYVDELAVPVFGLVAALSNGLGGLLSGLGSLIGMSDIFDPIGKMLTDLASVIQDLLPS
jgi:hypothetical protein